MTRAAGTSLRISSAGNPSEKNFPVQNQEYPTLFSEIFQLFLSKASNTAAITFRVLVQIMIKEQLRVHDAMAESPLYKHYC